MWNLRGVGVETGLTITPHLRGERVSTIVRKFDDYVTLAVAGGVQALLECQARLVHSRLEMCPIQENTEAGLLDTKPEMS